MLELREANLADARAEWAFIRDMPENENGVENRWHGCTWEVYRDTALPRTIAMAKGEGLPEGYVPCTAYFLWAEGEIVGLFKLRHYLSEALRTGAGHIGYYVKPEARGRGYATEGLRLLLERARDVVPEEEYYLRLFNYNAPSLRVMQKNGGRIAGEDGEHYYVRIPK